MQRFLHLLLSLIFLLGVSACTGGAVVYAPTPLPPDTSPLRYEHPTGTFSLILPRDWSVFVPESIPIVTAAFSPPGSSDALLQVSVIKLDENSLQTTDFGEQLRQYQTQLRPDLEHYEEQDRQAMGDGSWRLTGLRTDAGGTTQQINTFIQRDDPLFSVIEVIMPADPALQSALQTIINTYELNTAADLPENSLSALSNKPNAEFEILNVATWHNAENVFYITGEIANHSQHSIKDVPVRALLRSADGSGIAEAIDFVMGHALPPGGFAPFSLRFGQGQPISATNYTLFVGTEDWQPELAADVIGLEALSITDERSYDSNDVLQISGEITNESNQAIQNIQVILTVFDERQRVIAARFADISPGILAPDETTSYLIAVPEIGGTPASYIVNVQAFPCTANCN